MEAYDLSGVLNGYALEDASGNGIMYSTHVYPWKKGWQKSFLDAAAKYPIFVGEVGADVKKMDFLPLEVQEDPYTWVPDMLGVWKARAERVEGRSVDGARTEDVHPNSSILQLDQPGAGEGTQRRLARAVDAKRRKALDPVTVRRVCERSQERTRRPDRWGHDGDRKNRGLEQAIGTSIPVVTGLLESCQAAPLGLSRIAIS